MGQLGKRLTFILICLSFLLGLPSCGFFQNGDPYEGLTDGTLSGIEQIDVGIVDEPANSDGGVVEAYQRDCVSIDSESEIKGLKFFYKDEQEPDKQFVILERDRQDSRDFIIVEWQSPNYNFEFGRLPLQEDLDLTSVSSRDNSTTVSVVLAGEAQDIEMVCTSN